MKTSAIFPMLIFAVIATAANADNLRIATYNVHYDNFDSDQMIDAIRTANADIVCLQEASQRTIQIVQDQLGDHYPSISIKGQFGFATKHKSAETIVDPSGRYFAAAFDVDGSKIRVVNTHLTPIDLPNQPSLIQVMGAPARSDQSHVKQISSILARVDPELPTIILGDFNALSKAQAITKLRGAGFRDSLASVNKQADRQATWDWQTMLKMESKQYNRNNLGIINAGGAIEFGMRIDYIFHTDHFKTTESKVIRRSGSDHFLIVSELSLTPNKQP